MSDNQDPDLLDDELDSFIQPGCKVFRSQLPSQLPGSLVMDARPLRYGVYGCLFNGSWRRPSDEQMAVGIKVLRPSGLIRDNRLTTIIIRETAIWATVSHRNILPFIGYKLADEDLMLVSPWCEQGNLRDYTYRHPKITRGEEIRLLRDAACGLSHLHSLNPPIAHGRIQSDNVLVLDNLEAALCDYGVSTVRLGLERESKFEVEDPIIGPARYQAKEILEGRMPTPSADVYAFGGLILETMSGKEPFWMKRHLATIVAIVTDQTPKPEDHPRLPATDPLWSLLRDCWNGYPQSRPTMPHVLFELEQELWREDRLPKPRLSEDRLPKPKLSPSPPPPGNEVESLVRPGYYVFAREFPPPIRGTLTKTGELAFRGGSGDVYRGLWSPPDAKAIPVVIKCVRPPDKSQKDTFETRVKRETTIWRMVKHRNILPFIGYQIVDEVPMLVSPWCENGNLATYIDANPELTRNDKLKLLRGAARGLVHLHSLNPPIYHGDIKPQNILVDDDLEAMLCDFGISRFILKAGDHSGFTTSDTCSGTWGYQAGEILDEGKPTTAADVYAFSGLILATMSGHPPFWKKSPSAKIVAVAKGEMPKPEDHPKLPKTDPLWALMRECWSPEPGSRPDMTTLSSDLWV